MNFIIVEMPKFWDDRKLEKIRIEFHAWIILNLRRGVSFYREPFKPLSSITVQSRRKGSRLPLNDTGRLAQSIRVEKLRTSLRLRAGVIYAFTHQFGAVITPKRAKALTIPINPQARYGGWVKGAKFIFAKRVVIPQRPFFPIPERGLPPELLERIRNIIIQ